jgi:hypothetical protein
MGKTVSTVLHVGYKDVVAAALMSKTRKRPGKFATIIYVL